jgi:AmiR/NasT family two-component response regulator
VGVLTLYGDLPGPLSADQHDDSLAMSAVLAETMLSLQDAAAPGRLAPGLEDAVAYRAQVHQATGMVAIQLHITAFDALVRIRAYAFANGLSIEQAAADIVARRVRLVDDRIQPTGEV